MGWFELIPIGEIVWRIDPQWLEQQIQLTWSQSHVNITIPSEAKVGLLSWEIVLETDLEDIIDSPVIDGALEQDHLSLILFEHFEPCVDFVVWYRKIVPAKQRMLFQDDEHIYQIEVLCDTTKRQIIKTFEPELSLIQWRVLNLILANNNPIPVNLLLEKLDMDIENNKMTPEELDKAIVDIWNKELISSPGARWLSYHPRATEGLISNHAWSRQLTLTTLGRIALTARNA